MKITMTPVDELVPYAGNARTHSDAQIAQIAASMSEFGFTNPILAGGDKMIIAGHGRLLAAQQLGMEAVPVIVLGDLSEAQRRALVIADNKLAENAGWDEELLRVELAALGELDFDLDLLGFSEDELDDLLGDLDGMALGETEGEDDVPEPPEDPVSRPGDLWILGKHRLLCGDATVATDVDRVLNGTQPLLMVTDPPYGVKYDPAWRNQLGAAKTKRFVTPEARHRGDDRDLLASRHAVYQAARDRHPTRWSGETRNWQQVGSVWLNPERPDNGRVAHGTDDALPMKLAAAAPKKTPHEEYSCGNYLDEYRNAPWIALAI